MRSSSLRRVSAPAARPLMARKALACLVVVSFLTGCLKSSFNIPVSEAPRIETGKVANTDGATETLDSSYTVLPVPYKGLVFRYQPQRRDLVLAYPKEDASRPPLSYLKGISPLPGPVRARLTESHLILVSPERSLWVSPLSVSYLKIIVPSPGKTTALVLGAGTGVALIAGLLVLFALSFRNFGGIVG